MNMAPSTYASGCCALSCTLNDSISNYSYRFMTQTQVKSTPDGIMFLWVWQNAGEAGAVRVLTLTVGDLCQGGNGSSSRTLVISGGALKIKLILILGWW